MAERGGAPAPERGLLLDFCKSILIRIILIIKTSILYRHSAVASCHFPRLLGKARPYYQVMPSPKQRFREMFRQAKHDRKQSKRVKKQTFTIVSCRGDQWSPALSLIKRTTSVIPSVAEESRGNERVGLITAIPPPQKNAKKRGAAVKNRKPAFSNY